MPRNLLIPSAGAWFGAYPAGSNGAPTAYQAANMADRLLNVVTRYYKLDGTWPSTADKALMTGGQMLHVRWSAQLAAGGYASWASIAAGTYDTQITAQAHVLAGLSGPLFVSFCGEFDNSINRADSPSGSGPLSNFAAAWQHTWNIVAPIAQNVVWCWVATGSNTSLDAAAYPGDAYVDWMGYDPYDATLAHGSPHAAYLSYLTWLSSQSFGAGKPIGIFETGVQTPSSTNGVTDSAEATWISQVPAALQALGVQMWLWFNGSGSLGTTVITPGSNAASALATAGATPFFNQIGAVSSAPYLVGTGTAAAGATTLVYDVVGSTNTGDALVAAVSVNAPPATTTVQSVTDTRGNTWTLADSDSNDSSGEPTYVFVADGTVALSAADSDKITVTFTGTTPTGGNRNLVVVGVPGASASGAVDQTSPPSHSSTAAPSATTPVLSQAPEIAIAVASNQSGGGAISWASGWTPLGSAAASQYTGVAYQNCATTAAVTASGTLSAPVFATMVVVTLTLAGATTIGGAAAPAGAGTVTATATIGAPGSVAGSAAPAGSGTVTAAATVTGGGAVSTSPCGYPFWADYATVTGLLGRTSHVAATYLNGPGAQVLGGVLPSGGQMALSASSGLTVTVATGYAVCPADAQPDGGYLFGLMSAATLDVAAADPGVPRVDLVAAFVVDNGDATSYAAVGVVTGTPVAGANLANLNGAPAAPVPGIILGYVLVPPGALTIPAASVASAAPVTVAQGGILPVTAAAAPAGYAGMYVHDPVSGRFLHNPPAGPRQPAVLPSAPQLAQSTTSGNFTGGANLVAAQVTVVTNGATDLEIRGCWRGFAQPGGTSLMVGTLALFLDGVQLKLCQVINGDTSGNIRGGSAMLHVTSAGSDRPSAGTHTVTLQYSDNVATSSKPGVLYGAELYVRPCPL